MTLSQALHGTVRLIDNVRTWQQQRVEQKRIALLAWLSTPEAQRVSRVNGPYDSAQYVTFNYPG